MKNKNKELDVDLIGAQNDPPTKEEFDQISTFIKKLKEGKKRKRSALKSKSQST